MNSKELGENYNKIAGCWTAEMDGPEYGMTYIRKAMSLAKKNSVVLDIGYGSTGRTCDEALKNGFEITGIDVSSEMIKIAKEKYPGVTFIHDDFMNWNPSGLFDLIIAWDSIFHAPKNLQKDITIKMCKLLNKDGILLFTAGGIDGECSGEMQGVRFEYGSLKYLDYLHAVDEMGCKTILMESDQHPLDHMVFICHNKKR